MESMTRGLGWRFLDVGRRLERGIQIVALVRHGLVEVASNEPRRLETVLEVADSAMTYRSRYLTSVEVPPVLDLLLLDEDNPRALAFQLQRLQSRFETLARAPVHEVAALRDGLRGVSLADLAEVEEASEEEGARRVHLARLVSEFERALPGLGDALDHAYLSHAIPRRQQPRVGGTGT